MFWSSNSLLSGTGTAAILKGELTSNASNAAFYSLDGEASVPFELFSPGFIGDNGIVWTYQNLFSISNMTPGTHSLVVTHNGTTSGMPLTVEYLQVTSLTTTQQAVLSSSSPSLSST